MDERQSIGDINFDDYGYYLAVAFRDYQNRAVPLEVGRISATTFELRQEEEWLQNVIEEIPLIDCKDILPADVIEGSALSIRNEILADLTRCLDLSDAWLNWYIDRGVMPGTKNFSIRFEKCDPSLGVSCLSDAEIEIFLKKSCTIHLYESRTRVDYSARSNYFLIDMKTLSRDRLS